VSTIKQAKIFFSITLNIVHKFLSNNIVQVAAEINAEQWALKLSALPGECFERLLLLEANTKVY